MKITLRHWTENHDSVSVDRGPLTYSLKIGEQYVREGGTDEWPAWEIHPTTPWNYGLVLRTIPPQLLRGRAGQSGPPTTCRSRPGQSPIQTASPRQTHSPVDSGFARTGGHAAAQPRLLRPNPPKPITLIPMGAARLRISSFPVIGEGPEAHRWPEPPRPEIPSRRLSLLDIRYGGGGCGWARAKEFRGSTHPTIHLVGSSRHGRSGSRPSSKSRAR